MRLLLENLPWILLFVGVLLFVEAVYFLLRDMRHGGSVAINRRMRLLQSNKEVDEVRRLLLRDHKKGLSRAMGRLVPWLERELVQSGSSITLPRLFVIMVFLSVVAGVVVYHTQPMPVFLAVAAGAGIGVGLPYLFLRLRRRRRLHRFMEQLPDALNLMVRSLRAGHPISVTMSTVASEMGDPLGTEFGIAVDEMTYGLTLYEALANMATRNPSDDLRFFTVAVQIQHQIGGNLAEVIANIEDVIRERFRMFAKVKAISAEGRFSGWAIGLLPVFVWGVLRILRPDYYGAVQSDPLFQKLMVTAVILLGAGAFVIWRLVNFKV